MIETLLEAERLLVMGMLDQAERLYRRTVDADPRNAMALVGLARVAVERGDDRLAYDHACAALGIDPRNAAALRLEARLSEVMTARGESVERPAWLGGAGGVPPAQPPRAREELAADPGSATDDDLGRLAQRTALARNRSMTDHRRMTEEPAPDDTSAGPGEATPRRGFLRRLLRR